MRSTEPKSAGRTASPDSERKPNLELLRMFASMTLIELKILHGKLNGMNTVQIAQRYGCTKQNVSKVWLQACKYIPALSRFNCANICRRRNYYASSQDYKPGNHRP